jgi:hypothetical protein
MSLSSAASNGRVIEGTSPVALTLSSVAAGATVSWKLSPALGTVATAADGSASYAPPPVGQISTPTAVTITANASDGTSASLSLTIALLPFDIVAVSPDATSPVGVDEQPSARLSRPVAPASVTASSVSMASAIATVPATASVDGSTITLAPGAPLVWGGHYTVNLSPALASTAGQSLAPTSFQFDVAAPTWTSAASLSVETPYANTPRLASDKAGHVFAAFVQGNGSGDGSGLYPMGTLQVAEFDLATHAWSGLTSLAQPGITFQAEPSLAIDAAGDMIAVWLGEAPSGGTFNVYAARRVAGQSGWQAPVLIQTVSSFTAFTPRIAMDAAGDAVAVWPQSTNAPTDFHLYAAHFEATTGTWSTAVGLSQADDAGSPQVGIDAAGNAIVAWMESGLSPLSAQTIKVARRMAASGTWSAPSALPGSSNSSAPTLLVTPAGDATVAWVESPSFQSAVPAFSRFDTVAGTWSASPAPMASAEEMSGLQVRRDAAGGLFATWAYARSTREYGVQVCRQDPSGNWSAVTTLSSTTLNRGLLGSLTPALFVDPAGNATVLWDWTTDGFTFTSQQARYDSHLATWSAAAPIPGAGTVSDVISGAGDPQGNVLATWTQPGTNGATAWWALLSGS